MDTVFNMLDTNSNKFYFDESNKKKIIVYQIYKKYPRYIFFSYNEK